MRERRRSFRHRRSGAADGFENHVIRSGPNPDHGAGRHGEAWRIFGVPAARRVPAERHCRPADRIPAPPETHVRTTGEPVRSPHGKFDH